MDHGMKMAAARDVATFAAPALAPYLADLQLVAIPNWPPEWPGKIATRDDRVTIYDPEWAAETDVQGLGYALAHECLHIFLRHLDEERLAHASPGDRNIAMDRELYVLMPDLPEPYPSFTPGQLGLPDGLTAEEYYREGEDGCGEGTGPGGQDRLSRRPPAT